MEYVYDPLALRTKLFFPDSPFVFYKFLPPILSVAMVLWPLKPIYGVPNSISEIVFDIGLSFGLLV